MSARWVLDTNIVSLSLRGDVDVRRHLSRVRRDALAVTVVTWAELEYASRRSQTADAHRRAWQQALRGLPVLSFTREEAPEHARIRETLRAHPIGERDLLIAAIAMANGFGVVTRNAREFRRVRGLKVEEWA